jgi:hypothetical protein
MLQIAHFDAMGGERTFAAVTIKAFYAGQSRLWILLYE